MRGDEFGFFWEDEVKHSSKKGGRAVMPSIPDTGWKGPDLNQYSTKGAKAVAIDTETFDPDLIKKGPGWSRGVGNLVGVSIATEYWVIYIPIRHEVRTDENIDERIALLWLRDNLESFTGVVIGANLLYDLGWLRQEGITIPAKAFYDIQYAEPLIDENQFSYSLEAISNKYMGEGKVSSELYEWSAKAYGGQPTRKQAENIYRCPPCLVGPYAEADARLPFEVFKQQWEILESENLIDLFLLECRLIPLLLDMRFRGVRVDIDKAERVRDELQKGIDESQSILNKLAGTVVEVNSSQSIAYAFDKAGLPYGMTEKGNPTFPKEFLANHPSDIAKYINEVRKLEKVKGTFVENYILESHIDGRIYGQFHPLKGDSGGTVSGRFAASSPNLQNIPSRDKIFGPMVRGLFIPDDGYDLWGKLDHSQVEYRCLAHYAIGGQSDRIRHQYRTDPNVDFHQMTGDLVKEMTGQEIERGLMKNTNFGFLYGMSENKVATMFGIEPENARRLFDAYHRGAPFVKTTFNHAMRDASDNGHIVTAGGRRCRFPLWQDANDYGGALMSYSKAREQFGMNITRALTYKALNRLLQGSAADIMKFGMVKAYEDGIFDALGGPPHLTVHDELDISYRHTDKEALKALINAMEQALTLEVPLKVDVEMGNDWGHVKEFTVE